MYVCVRVRRGSRGTPRERPTTLGRSRLLFFTRAFIRLWKRDSQRGHVHVCAGLFPRASGGGECQRSRVCKTEKTTVLFGRSHGRSVKSCCGSTSIETESMWLCVAHRSHSPPRLRREQRAAAPEPLNDRWLPKLRSRPLTSLTLVLSFVT